MGSVLDFPDGTGARKILSMMFADAATPRSSLELLSRPLPFSQVRLLDVGDFVKEADKRRVKVWGGFDFKVGALEELHRCGLLVPLYGVRLGDGESARQLDISSSMTPEHTGSSIVRELYAAAEEGRLFDPAAEPFEPWPKGRIRTEWPTVETGYLYSTHQLLGLAQMADFVAMIQPIFKEDGPNEWFIHDDDLPDAAALEASASWRAIAITLCAIDTRTWPNIITVLTGNRQVWQDAVDTEEPAELLAWLELDEGRLREQSSQLRSWAGFKDDLGDFYDVVRRADPSRWSSLTGPVRSAMDARMAAQAFDNFASELPGATTPPPAHLPFSMRPLSEHEMSLDAVLTHFRLSPHPSLVIVLEGKTEMVVVPQVMRYFGIPVDAHWVRLIDGGGVNANLKRLAHYVAEPGLGTDIGRVVLLERPITRFLVFVDAEGQYKTAVQRAQLRQQLLDEVTKDIPEELQPDLYDPETAIVEILTWGTEPFEFANFTDEELADLLELAAGKKYRLGRRVLMSRIHAERERTSHRSHPRSPDIEMVWRRSRVKKANLAKLMWPMLQTKMEVALQDGSEWPPVFRTVGRARELVFRDYGVNMSLRKYPIPGRP